MDRGGQDFKVDFKGAPRGLPGGFQGTYSLISRALLTFSLAT